MMQLIVQRIKPGQVVKKVKYTGTQEWSTQIKLSLFQLVAEGVKFV
jgi:hypothetical protein